MWLGFPCMHVLNSAVWYIFLLNNLPCTGQKLHYVQRHMHSSLIHTTTYTTTLAERYAHIKGHTQMDKELPCNTGDKPSPGIKPGPFHQWKELCVCARHNPFFILSTTIYSKTHSYLDMNGCSNIHWSWDSDIANLHISYCTSCRILNQCSERRYK